MGHKIVYSFLIIMIIVCLMYPSVSRGEDYFFERLWPSEILGLICSVDVAVDGTNVYVADTDLNRVIKYNSSGSVLLTIGEFGTGNGQFDGPSGVAVDSFSGYIYVADRNNHRIQIFNSSGVYQNQWGTYGSGDGEFNGPTGVAIDSFSGYIYVADTWNNRIQKFDTSGVYQNQWGTYGAGDGEFNGPSGVAVYGVENIYVADKYNHRIQLFNSSGVYQDQWGTYGAGNGQFNGPSGVAVYGAGNIYVADTWNNRIQKFDSSGVYQNQWGTYGSGDSQFSVPYGVAVDGSGNIYVADTYNRRIKKLDSSGSYLTQWGKTECYANSQFYNPNGIALDSSGNVFVADTYNNRIQKFSSTGGYQTQWGTQGTGSGQFYEPNGVAVDSLGYVYVADTDNARIQKFNSTGGYQIQWGTQGTGDGQFDGPSGVAVDSFGYVYVADKYNHRIQKFDSSGGYQTQWGTQGTGDGQFDEPSGVAVDNLGYVYVADTYNNRIQKFDSDGNYITQWGIYGAGDVQFDRPSGVAADSLGNAYVTDTYNNRIQKFDTNGYYITQWGILGAGDEGDDDGDDENIQFYGPSGIAVNALGKVYVADTYNHRIQVFHAEITMSLPPGWNMISVPGDPVISDIPTLVAGKPLLPYGKVYNPVTQAYENKTTLEFGKGYWFGGGESTSVTIEYFPRTSLTASLSPGWNMVGSVSGNAAMGDLVVDPTGSILPYAKWYNPATRTYVNVYTIEPGKGYWFGAGYDCSISMFYTPIPPASPPKQNILESTKPSWEGVLSINTQKKHKNMVFGMHKSASDEFDILYDDPTSPLPDLENELKIGWLVKDSVFPMLDKSIVQEDTEAELELSVELSEAGELSWRNIPEAYSCMLVYDNKSLDMHKEQILSLPSGKYSIRILLSKREDMPTQTSLLANYPNPFNPETWIPFELSVDTKVEIMIYSSSGQLVRKLDLGYKSAGRYTQRVKSAYWDGKNEAGENVSSGVYFYTLVTPEFSNTRKLVIVR